MFLKTFGFYFEARFNIIYIEENNQMQSDTMTYIVQCNLINCNLINLINCNLVNLIKCNLINQCNQQIMQFNTMVVELVCPAKQSEG